MSCHLDALGNTGRYDFTCVNCCARLIRDSRPSKARQEGMFATIARTPGAQPRDAILAALGAK